MKNALRTSHFAKAVILFTIAAVAVSWQPEKRKREYKESLYTNGQDTIAPKSANPDQAEFQLNLDSVMQQVNAAIAKIDYNKINAEVQKAMASIDYNKMNKEIRDAMKNIDWNSMNLDVSKALDSAKMAIDKIDWDKIKAETSQAQVEARRQMAMQKINVDSIKIQVQKSLKEAQKSLQAARIEFINYKGLQTALQRDGLIKAGKPYTIQLKGEILYINGVKQTQTVTNKYNHYYSGKKNFTISSDGKDETDL